jgi:hypothetical protein
MIFRGILDELTVPSPRDRPRLQRAMRDAILRYLTPVLTETKAEPRSQKRMDVDKTTYQYQSLAKQIHRRIAEGYLSEMPTIRPRERPCSEARSMVFLDPTPFSISNPAFRRINHIQ